MTSTNIHTKGKMPMVSEVRDLDEYGLSVCIDWEEHAHSIFIDKYDAGRYAEVFERIASQLRDYTRTRTIEEVAA